MDAFGPTLDYFCKRQGITLKDLAEQIGVSRNTLSNWKAKGKPSTQEITVKLAKKLILDEDETDALLVSAGYAPKYNKSKIIPSGQTQNLQTQKNSAQKTISFATVIIYMTQTTISWLDALRNTLLEKRRDLSAEKSIDFKHNYHQIVEKEEHRHLELALKNAMERGLSKFQRSDERDQYRHVLAILNEPSTHSDALRSEILRLYTLFDEPNFDEINEAYNHSLRARSPDQQMQSDEVEAVHYISSFFDALIDELSVDSLFESQMKILPRVNASVKMRRTLIEIVASLRKMGEGMSDNYTVDRFEEDLQKYVAHVERTFRYLKLVGIVPRERDRENKDPELDDIFIPLRISLQTRKTPEPFRQSEQYSIVTELEISPCLVLLGGPGSGKSTVTRHLAWSHAYANLPNSLSGSRTVAHNLR